MFVTPLCALSLYALRRRWASRHLVVFTTCMIQAYQTVLFFIEPFQLDADRPNVPVGANSGFLFEFLFMNCMWLVVPAMIIRDCWGRVSAAMQARDAKIHD